MGRIVGTTLCAVGAALIMTAPSTAQDLKRCSTVEKGSLVWFHKVEVRASVPLNQATSVDMDTFISLTNDNNLGPINVQLYFVNGDDPVYDPQTGALLEPGWNWQDAGIIMTKDQPAWWSACTGRPGPQGAGSGPVQPWNTLDPNGRLDPMTGQYYLRGFIVGWVVDDNGEEIRWNHLKGEGTIVDYLNGYAWEYQTLNFKVVANVNEGSAPDAVPGEINMDGVEYATAFDKLVMNFQASGSHAWGDPDWTWAPYPVKSDTDVTLHPLDLDLRQNNDGPTCTKADILVWNENETKMSGNHRCIWCWDQQLMKYWDLPGTNPPAINTFLRDVLQTDHGKAVIDGVAATLCDTPDYTTVATALAGVSARILKLDPYVNVRYAASGANMVGKGDQSAKLIYDPQSSGGEELTVPATESEIADFLQRSAGIEAGVSTKGTSRR